MEDTFDHHKQNFQEIVSLEQLNYPGSSILSEFNLCTCLDSRNTQKLLINVSFFKVVRVFIKYNVNQGSSLF